jgi:hypothetical protein
MFASALKFAKTQFAPSTSAAQEPINERAAMQAHEQAYNKGNAGSMDGNSMAMAAAMQAMKMFTGGGGNQNHNANVGGGQSGMVSFFPPLLIPSAFLPSLAPSPPPRIGHLSSLNAQLNPLTFSLFYPSSLSSTRSVWRSPKLKSSSPTTVAAVKHPTARASKTS